MIFVCVNAGHYLILQEDAVVATVTRQLKKDPSYHYRVDWKYYPERSTNYKTLADIQEDLQFENYGGYNSILKRRTS